MHEMHIKEFLLFFFFQNLCTTTVSKYAIHLAWLLRVYDIVFVEAESGFCIA